MSETYSQNMGTRDSWNNPPLRAAGLYGELQPLPLPVAAPLSSSMTRKPRLKAASTD